MKPKMKNIPILTLAAITLLTLSTHAQFAIDWSTMDGGGGVSSGGAYSVSGTIGQPDAGQLAGGDYTLSGGFWGGVDSSPPEPVPALTVSRLGTSVVVTWPFPSTGFALQQTTALLSPPSAIFWTDVPSPAAVHVGSEWAVTIPSPASNRFFRLRKP